LKDENHLKFYTFVFVVQKLQNKQICKLCDQRSCNGTKSGEGGGECGEAEGDSWSHLNETK
jgi:hypothetical protein